MRKILIAALIIVGGAVFAADIMSSGANNVTNNKTGPVVYSFNMKWNSVTSKWDMDTGAGGGDVDATIVNASSTPAYVYVTNSPSSAPSAFTFVSATSTVAAITASSVQMDIPTTTKAIIMCANGNTAYLRFGSDPTATTSIGGYDFPLLEGTCTYPAVVTEAKVAVIGASAAGTFFIRRYTY